MAHFAVNYYVCATRTAHPMHKLWVLSSLRFMGGRVQCCQSLYWLQLQCSKQCCYCYFNSRHERTFVFYPLISPQAQVILARSHYANVKAEKAPFWKAEGRKRLQPFTDSLRKDIQVQIYTLPSACKKNIVSVLFFYYRSVEQIVCSVKLFFPSFLWGAIVLLTIQS